MGGVCSRAADGWQTSKRKACPWKIMDTPFINGGRAWIRTKESMASRFTVCFTPGTEDLEVGKRGAWGEKAFPPQRILGGVGELPLPNGGGEREKGGLGASSPIPYL